MKRPAWRGRALFFPKPRHYVRTGIIGEPTSLQPIRAHKGHISNVVRASGAVGHSSDPARGVNADELMHDAIGHIVQLRDSKRGITTRRLPFRIQR